LFKVYGGSDLAENPIGMVGISPESPLFMPKEITDTMRYVVTPWYSNLRISKHPWVD